MCSRFLTANASTQTTRVFADDARRQLVPKIPAAESLAGMQLRYLAAGLLSILGTLLVLRVATLQRSKPLLILGEEALIAGFLARREGHSRM